MSISCNNNPEMGSTEFHQGSSKKVVNEQTKQIIRFTVAEIDSLYNNGNLSEKIYPTMSACGGQLIGFYFDEELKLINSKYNAELGYSTKKIYWNGNTIQKIIYRKQSAE